jgi:hypothetical protein
MDFLERLKAEVADSFPFEEGEDFDAWCARVRLEPIGSRALLVATVESIGKRMDVETGQRKKAWIAAARPEFGPGERKPCFVCHRFEGITQAKVPLRRQFDLGYETAAHDYEWLCPNHHVIVHFHVDEIWRDTTRWSRTDAASEDVTQRESRHIADLIKRSVGKPR